MHIESYHSADEALLENFIRLSKYNLERAKKKFESYIIVRNDLLKSSVELTNEDLETDLGRLSLIFPDLTPEGHRILYGRSIQNVDAFDMNTTVNFMLEICDILLHSDVSAGLVIIFDLKSFSLNFMTKLDMVIVKSFFNIIFNIQPTRIHRCHVINTSQLGKTFFSILMSLMSEKIKKRVIFHSEEQELLQYLGKDLLPSDLGGMNSSIPEMRKQWKEYVIGNEVLRERKRAMVLRHPVPKSKAHLDPSSGFGQEGSFRKIELD